MCQACNDYNCCFCMLGWQFSTICQEGGQVHPPLYYKSCQQLEYSSPHLEEDSFMHQEIGRSDATYVQRPASTSIELQLTWLKEPTMESGGPRNVKSAVAHRVCRHAGTADICIRSHRQDSRTSTSKVCYVK